MGKDRRNIVHDSSECRRKVGEGKVIVLKGDPLYAALFLIIIVTVEFTFSFQFRRKSRNNLSKGTT